MGQTESALRDVSKHLETLQGELVHVRSQRYEERVASLEADLSAARDKAAALSSLEDDVAVKDEMIAALQAAAAEHMEAQVSGFFFFFFFVRLGIVG